jgi:hypothetical protein
MVGSSGEGFRFVEHTSAVLNVAGVDKERQRLRVWQLNCLHSSAAFSVAARDRPSYNNSSLDRCSIERTFPCNSTSIQFEGMQVTMMKPAAKICKENKSREE